MHAVLCCVLFLVCMGSLSKLGGIVVGVLAVTTNRGGRVEPFLHSLFLSRNKTPLPLPPRLASHRPLPFTHGTARAGVVCNSPARPIRRKLRMLIRQEKEASYVQ